MGQSKASRRFGECFFQRVRVVKVKGVHQRPQELGAVKRTGYFQRIPEVQLGVRPIKLEKPIPYTLERGEFLTPVHRVAMGRVAPKPRGETDGPRLGGKRPRHVSQMKRTDKQAVVDYQQDCLARGERGVNVTFELRFTDELCLGMPAGQ